jgi:hypothetical protein
MTEEIAIVRLTDLSRDRLADLLNEQTRPPVAISICFAFAEKRRDRRGSTNRSVSVRVGASQTAPLSWNGTAEPARIPPDGSQKR